MGQLETAMANVKTAISKTRSKNKSSYEETIGQVSSYLVFLRSTALSKEAANKLSKCLRERLAHIYGAFPQQGIELAAALCKTLYETKILTEFTAGNQEQKLLWDNVMNALLSGVLDFYDEKPDAKRKEVIGVVLYPTLCSTFFSISISHMSVDLRCTGYTLLSETADAHKANQTRLQDISILGGSRLGSILWRTREFLVLESVLNLFARMIPSTGGTQAGKAARTAFIRSVFVESSPDCAETGEKLARLLEKVRTADWDQTATQILDVLASSNIAFPQPFEVTDVTTCDKAKTVDRLYVDEKGFIGNILLDEDTCDSLSVSYDTVTAIQVLSKSTAKRQENPQVTLFLSIPPIIGKDPITPPCTSEQPSGHPTVTFRLLKIDLVRFQQAMKSRGMEHLVAVDRGAKSSILASPAKLEMDSAGQLIEDMQLAQRIENLSQLYGTNDPSDGSPKGTEPGLESVCGAPTRPLTHDTQKQETGTDPIAGHEAARLSTSCAKKLNRTAGASPLQRDASTHSNSSLSKISGSLAAARPDSSSAPKAITHTSAPLQRTKSQAILEAVFGTSEDELSDIEDVAKPREHPKLTKSDDKKLATGAHLASRSRKALESDDDIPSTPTHLPARKPVKKLVIVSDDEDEIEEVIPASKLSSSVISRRRSTLNLAPVDKGLSAGSVRKLSTTVVISTEDPPRDESVSGQKDSKLVGEVVLRKEASDLAGLVPNTILASTASRTPESGARSNDKAARDVPTKPTKGKSSRICDDESKPPLSSSPVRLQAVRKSVKSALRNKNGTAPDGPQPPSHVKQPKRRRELNASVDGGNNGDSDLDDGDARPGPRKRSKGTAVENEVEAKVRTTSGPALAVKRYGGRKGRTSSPVIANHPSVDYDSIPKTPPASVSDHREKSSALPAKDAKLVPQNTKAVAPLEKKRGKPKPVRKAKANTDPVVVQSPDAPPEHPRIDGRITRSKRATAAKEVVEVSSPENSETKVTNGALASNKKNLQAVLADPIREQDCFVAGLETEDGTHMSTPRLQEKPRRKSNRKPWNALPAAAPVIKEQDAGASEARINAPDASMVASENNEAGSVHDQPSDVAEYEDTTMVEEDVKNPVLNKSLAERERNVTIKEHVVDLTEASPIKQASALLNVEKQNWLARLSKEHFADADEDESPRPPRIKPSVTFAQAPMRIQEIITKSTPPPKSRSKAAGVTRTAGDNLFKREITVPTATTKTRVRPPSIENIAKVLDEIQEAILRKIHSNVEGVREEVRLGRERLMADASADLMRMRAESITRYNLLIELEAEYATFGRNVAYGLDDLVQVNHKIESEIKKIIQDHNRGGISKKAPTSLFSATLPASIVAFKA